MNAAMTPVHLVDAVTLTVSLAIAAGRSSRYSDAKPLGISLTSGVHPGETVVTDGQSRLVPGAEVQVSKTGAGGGAGE